MITDSSKLRKKPMTSVKHKVLQGMGFSKQSTTTPDSHGDLSDTMTLPAAKSNIIRSIKDLSLEKFITCSVDGDYSVLGDGTEDEQYTAWVSVIGQFHAASGNEKGLRYVEVVAGIKAIEFRQQIIENMVKVLEVEYIPEMADLLREEHEMFELTAESYKDDIIGVRNREKRHLFTMEDLQAELKVIEEQLQSGTAEKSSREDYIELLMDINQREGSSYDTSVSVEIFAIGLKRLQREHQRNKNKPHGNG